MTKPLSSVAFLALLCLLSLPLVAQQITPGMIVVVKSPSGRYLSAIPNETLGLTTNRVQWEQWEVVQPPNKGLHLRSYHGTALIVEYSRVYHAPLAEMDGIMMGGVKVSEYPGRTTYASFHELVNGGYMYYAIPYGGGNNIYFREAPGGELVPIEWWSGGDETVPASGRWTLEIVANPLGGRRPAQTPVYARTNNHYKLRSYHNTFLDATDPSDASKPASPVVTGAGGKYFTFQTLGRNKDWDPLRFGDSSLLWQACYGFRCELMPGPNDRLFWGPSNYSHYWKVLPTGSYRIGERVPLGESVLIQGAGGKNIGVTPEGTVYLHPNTAQWEWLRFSK